MYTEKHCFIDILLIPRSKSAGKASKVYGKTKRNAGNAYTLDVSRRVCGQGVPMTEQKRREGIQKPLSEFLPKGVDVLRTGIELYVIIN
jgi:hypothetical protein